MTHDTGVIIQDTWDLIQDTLQTLDGLHTHDKRYMKLDKWLIIHDTWNKENWTWYITSNRPMTHDTRNQYGHITLCKWPLTHETWHITHDKCHRTQDTWHVRHPPTLTLHHQWTARSRHHNWGWWTSWHLPATMFLRDSSTAEQGFVSSY